MIRTTVGLLLWAVSMANVHATEIPVFIFAGQSNAYGSSTATSHLAGDLSYLAPAQSDVLFYGPYQETADTSRVWAAMQSPTETVSKYVDGNGKFGPELSASYELQNTSGGQIAVVKFAIGGTNLYQNWNASSGGSYYYQMLSRVYRGLTKLQTDHGLTGRVEGFFWMQGESDAGFTVQANAYQTNLVNLVNRVRNDFDAPNLPFIVGEINNPDATATNNNTVRSALANLPNLVENAAFVDTDTFERSPIADDTIHFSSRGTVQLGNAFAAAYGGLSPAAHDPVNLVVNGSFEANIAPTAYERVTAANAGTLLSGWTVSGEAELLKRYADSQRTTIAAHGTQWLSLESTGGLATPNNVATLSQAIVTVPGQLYEFSFDYSVLSSSSVTGDWTLAFNYGEGVKSLSIPNVGSDRELATWSNYTAQFIATGTTTTISFTGQSRRNGFFGPAIDNVVLSAVPEPGAMGTFLLGWVALCIVHRRQGGRVSPRTRGSDLG